MEQGVRLWGVLEGVLRTIVALEGKGVPCRRFAPSYAGGHYRKER